MTEEQYKQFIRDMQESWSDTFGKLVNAISAQSGQSERFNKFWSDTLGIAFNGLISQREQLKER